MTPCGVHGWWSRDDRVEKYVALEVVTGTILRPTRAAVLTLIPVLFTSSC